MNNPNNDINIKNYDYIKTFNFNIITIQPKKQGQEQDILQDIATKNQPINYDLSHPNKLSKNNYSYTFQ